jgi:hypothetical protein
MDRTDTTALPTTNPAISANPKNFTRDAIVGILTPGLNLEREGVDPHLK